MSKQARVPEGFTPIRSENPFGKLVGPLYEKTEKDGGWVRGFVARAEHANRAGVVHGGMLMTFADIVLSQAVFLEGHLPFATVELEAKFVSPAQEGAWVEGRARVVRRTRDLVFVTGEVTSAAKPVLMVTALFKLL